MNRHSNSAGCLPVMILLTACATSAEQESAIGNTERKGFVAGIMLAEGATAETPPKVIVTSYAIRDAVLTPIEAVVTYGSGGLSTSSGEDYKLEMVNADGRILQSFSVIDPRKFVVEQQGVVENPTGVLTARFKFDRSAILVRIRDAKSKIVAESDLRPLINEFCSRVPRDPDCRAIPK